MAIPLYMFSWLLQLVLGLHRGGGGMGYLQIVKCVSVWLHSGYKYEGWDSINRFNHTICMAIVTPNWPS